MRIKYDNQTVKKVRADRKLGKTYKELGAAHGMSASMAQYCVKHRRLRKRNKAKTFTYTKYPVASLKPVEKKNTLLDQVEEIVTSNISAHMKSKLIMLIAKENT